LLELVCAAAVPASDRHERTGAFSHSGASCRMPKAVRRVLFEITLTNLVTNFYP